MQSGVMLSVGHVLRYDPVIHKIKVNSFCHTLCFLHQARVRALGLKISVWVLMKELGLLIPNSNQQQTHSIRSIQIS